MKKRISSFLLALLMVVSAVPVMATATVAVESEATLTADDLYVTDGLTGLFTAYGNEAEGNLYVRMGGGYLRVMYPAPETCLHLPAWREFYGFDMKGQNAWFDIDFNETEGSFSVKASAVKPFSMPQQIQRLNLKLTPELVETIAADPHVDVDVNGEERNAEKVYPGPFAQLLGEHPLKGYKA